jgi:hypothetical protein
MKKKIFGVIAIVAIAAAAAWNVNCNSQSSKLSDISLANVEALAQESGGGYGYVCCDGHNIQCIGNGNYKCCV